jgi:alkanesulfonate monooxygenase
MPDRTGVAAPTAEYLWYIPNQVIPGHRGDAVTADHNSLETLTAQARALEEYGWQGALIGTGWGRPDTFTVATALAARTTTFEPLVAVRPGYWRPAHFASAAASLDHLTGGRLRINIVSGKDDLAAYGEAEEDQADRYARTREFLRLVRRLWTEENVTHRGEHYRVTDSTVTPRITVREGRPHPRLTPAARSGSAASWARSGRWLEMPI